MKRSLKLLAVLAALALVLAACGGDDDSADTTGAPEATTGAPADTTAAPERHHGSSGVVDDGRRRSRCVG